MILQRITLEREILRLGRSAVLESLQGQLASVEVESSNLKPISLPVSRCVAVLLT